MVLEHATCPRLQVAWASGTEWEVAAGMLDIFHKLPMQAKKFLETQGLHAELCQEWTDRRLPNNPHMHACMQAPSTRALCEVLLSVTLPAGERPGIVVLTIGLEESLPKLPGTVIPSKLWSPYRLPLIRFLNQYPADRQACH